MSDQSVGDGGVPQTLSSITLCPPMSNFLFPHTYPRLHHHDHRQHSDNHEKAAALAFTKDLKHLLWFYYGVSAPRNLEQSDNNDEGKNGDGAEDDDETVRQH